MSKKPWYIGAENDGLFIIDRPLAPDNDNPVHDRDVNVIATVPYGKEFEAFAKELVEAHAGSDGPWRVIVPGIEIQRDGGTFEIVVMPNLPGVHEFAVEVADAHNESLKGADEQPERAAVVEEPIPFADPAEPVLFPDYDPLAQLTASVSDTGISFGTIFGAGDQTPGALVNRLVDCVNACRGITGQKLKNWLNAPDGETGIESGSWAQQLDQLGQMTLNALQGEQVALKQAVAMGRTLHAIRRVLDDRSPMASEPELNGMCNQVLQLITSMGVKLEQMAEYPTDTQTAIANIMREVTAADLTDPPEHDRVLFVAISELQEILARNLAGVGDVPAGETVAMRERLSLLTGALQKIGMRSGAMELLLRELLSKGEFFSSSIEGDPLGSDDFEGWADRAHTVLNVYAPADCELASLAASAAAVKTLTQAGYTYTEGAELWKPPVGPSSRPLLDKITRLEAERDTLYAVIQLAQKHIVDQSDYAVTATQWLRRLATDTGRLVDADVDAMERQMVAIRDQALVLQKAVTAWELLVRSGPADTAPAPTKAELKVTAHLDRENIELVAYVEPAELWHSDEGKSIVAGIGLEMMAALEKVLPRDLLLFCPVCGQQHIDAPEYAADGTLKWDNPPHRSHLCHTCGTIWRPADFPTNGVADIVSGGEKDTWGVDDHSIPAITPETEVLDAARWRRFLDVYDEYRWAEYENKHEVINQIDEELVEIGYEPGKVAPLPAFNLSHWTPVSELKPLDDDPSRMVVIYTEETDFAGQQFFMAQCGEFLLPPDEQEEVVALATHWIWADELERQVLGRVFESEPDIASTFMPEPPAPVDTHYKRVSTLSSANPTTEPEKFEYYHRDEACPAPNSASPDCCCWYRQGTGPRAVEVPSASVGVRWREIEG